jgi:quercetin dioxygenase-like cupin family protein
VQSPKLIVIGVALGGALASLYAQQPPFKRTILQEVELSVSGRQAVSAIAEIQPGAAVGRHTHPGEEIGYVIEGTIVVELEGKPALNVEPGHAFFIPAGAIHNATNSGVNPARILATYIVEKGKPLATPAAAK